MTNPSLNRTRWTREQIRAARLAPLLPLLQQRGLQLVAGEVGNFALPDYPGLTVKDSYRRWPERDLAGDTIDFCMRVLGFSFHEVHAPDHRHLKHRRDRNATTRVRPAQRGKVKNSVLRCQCGQPAGVLSQPLLYDASAVKNPRADVQLGN